MTSEEIKEAAGRLQAFIRLYAPGQCKILSLGERCPCLLCDVSRLGGSALTYLARLAADEQRERDVSELLRAVAKTPHDAEAATLVEQYIMCGPKNAAMFLRERNADDERREREDAEPITEEWLVSIGFTNQTMNGWSKLLDGDGSICEIFVSHEGDMSICQDSDHVTLSMMPRIETRGQLRKLLEALKGGAL